MNREDKITELTDFYMWMVENEHDHNIRLRVEKKAHIYLSELNQKPKQADFYCSTKRGCLEQCDDCALTELNNKLDSQEVKGEKESEDDVYNSKLFTALWDIKKNNKNPNEVYLEFMNRGAGQRIEECNHPNMSGHWCIDCDSYP